MRKGCHSTLRPVEQKYKTVPVRGDADQGVSLHRQSKFALVVEILKFVKDENADFDAKPATRFSVKRTPGQCIWYRELASSEFLYLMLEM